MPARRRHLDPHHRRRLLAGRRVIALTFHWWIATLVSALVTLATIIAWLWTGTATIPRENTRDIGLGETLPLYTSGPQSVGWWAMFITMAGDGTAYASLLFGYFFYWTIHEDFTAGHAGPGMFWPLAAAGLFTLAWGAMLVARRVNEGDRQGLTRLALALAILFTLAACGAGLVGPHVTGMDPTTHVYPAIVWVLGAVDRRAWRRRHHHAALLPGAQLRRADDARATTWICAMSCSTGTFSSSRRSRPSASSASFPD